MPQWPATPNSHDSWGCSYNGLDGDEICALNSRCPRSPGHPAADRRTGVPGEALALVRGRGSTHPQADRAGWQAPGAAGGKPGQPHYLGGRYQASSGAAPARAGQFNPGRKRPSNDPTRMQRDMPEPFNRDTPIWKQGNLFFKAHPALAAG